SNLSALIGRNKLPRGPMTKEARRTLPLRWLLLAFSILFVLVYRASGGRLMNTLAGRFVLSIGLAGDPVKPF
ncbi:hypothetical protein N9395_10420, partial [Pseudomonadales bacterium]|nr:hypothetical protein [Pseudomonadales bacterium]